MGVVLEALLLSPTSREGFSACGHCTLALLLNHLDHLAGDLEVIALVEVDGEE